MPTMRIFADSVMTGTVTASTTGKITWGPLYSRSPASIETTYHCRISADTDLPPVQSCVGAQLMFDLGQHPGLQGMKITGISGPWVYLTAKTVTLDIDTTRDYTYGCLATSPYLEASSIEPEDAIRGAPLGQYCDLDPVYSSFTLKENRYTFQAMLGIMSSPAIYALYEGSAAITFDSETMEHAPYIDVTYEVPTIKFTGFAPAGMAFADEKREQALSWTLGFGTPRDSITPLVQSSAQIQWREAADAGTVKTAAVEGANTFVSFPAGTFGNDVIEWRVSAEAESGAATGWSEWQRFTTVDATPGAPRNLTPNERTIDGSTPNVFAWEHVISTGSAQSRFRLEYSQDEATWELLADENSEQESVVVPAGTLPGKEVFWRVRTYNTDGEPGEWANALITVRGAPDAPIVTVTSGGNPRPSVTWQAQEQTGYQVAAPGYDSMERYGTDKRFTIPVFLPDGAQEIRVRVCNRYEVWSKWATVTAAIENKPGQSAALKAREVDCGVKLAWSGEAELWQVLRDGGTIAETEETQFDDWTADADGVHVYQVRGINAQGYYSMSNSVKARTRVRDAAAAALGEWDWVPLRLRRGSAPDFSLSQTQEVTYRKYSGRRLPVAEVFDRREEQFSTGFTVSPENARKLCGMLGKTVLLRYGERTVSGILDRVDISGERAGDWEDVKLSITCTDGSR